jgi:hypothetical protein
VTKHRTPWGVSKPPAFDDDVWELYDGTKDYSQAHDLAKEMPEKLHELQRLWLIEATKYNVIPLDDRTVERFNPEIAGRPQLIKGDTQVFYPGMTRLSENSVLSIKNKSFSVTAEVVVPDESAAGDKPLSGTIMAQGGAFGGWSFYAKDGRLRYCYNLLGIERFYVDSDRKIPVGTHQARMEFDYAGPGLGKGGTVRLFLNGEQLGEGVVGATAAMIFSADDTCDIGREDGALVADDYPASNRFTGEVNWVEIDIGDAAMNAAHQLEPDHLLRVAMARQ